MFPAAYTHKVKILALQRQANVQYDKAIRACSTEDSDDSCRYYLEAAKPRDYNSTELYRHNRRRYGALSVATPQLQPKNIDPYGKLNTTSWICPNGEYNKQSIIAQDQRRKKFENFLEKRKRLGSTSDDTKNPSSQQQREYCTLKMSSDLEKCKAIIAEYKKLNPDYKENIGKVPPGSQQEKRLIEETQKFISSVKNPQQSIELVAGSNEKIIASRNPVPAPSTSEKLQERRQNFQDQLDSVVKKQPKINLPLPSKEKLVLYYGDKNSKHTLCSKVVKDDPLANLSENSAVAEELDNVKVKIAPKLTLQSTNLDDRKYRADELIPGPNEKFLVPWLSWSDRVKLHASIKSKSEEAENRSAETQVVKPAQNNPTTITTNSLCANHEIQKRQFSQVSTIGFNNVMNSFHRQPKLFYEGENVNWSELWNRSREHRLFSTNSTRGVLGPEGTVMVKLRRLPKINIPKEPMPECDESLGTDCVRADGNLEIKQKKLPKLIVSPCPVPAPAKPAQYAPPLNRPKCRSYPKAPPRICPVPCPDQNFRADYALRRSGIVQKKLPKIVTKDCFPIVKIKMTSPKLPRLKAKPLPPPPPCEALVQEVCPPRADEGLEVIKKRLPPLQLPVCCPDCPTQMTAGPPLRRLKKVHVPEPEKICHDIADICPPRADDVLGYTVKKKKLYSLILGERHNNLSWKEYHTTKIKRQVRNYATDSKCNMCCYSDKKVHPEMGIEGDGKSGQWEKVGGRLFCEADGKIESYLPPEEIIDRSTGSELKIVKKPIGALYRRDTRIHEELLKSGFTCSLNDYRKFCSTNEPCNIPPYKTPYKDLKLKPLRKRHGFEEDFPSRVRFKKDLKEDECIDPCAEMDRMDDLLRYEVKQKRLPPIPRGTCERKPPAAIKPGTPLTRRLKKRFKFKSYDCPKEECINVCPPRADATFVEKYNKLIPMRCMSNCPQPPRRIPTGQSTGLKRLPKFPPGERTPCPPTECALSRPFRADAVSGRSGVIKKKLPYLTPSDCPPRQPPKMKAVPLRRLPKHPFMERIDDCRTPCQIQKYDRADVITNYQAKTKKLKPILKSNNRAFSTLPANFLFAENFTEFQSNRYISSSACLLTSDKRECKKLKKVENTRKCTKLNMPNATCKPAKNISCFKKKRAPRPCTKQKSPYPAFSECKEHYRPEVITECHERENPLQPRFPILSEIKTQKPPPPYQGKIDPSKALECIARKLNIENEGETKTCETFDKPDEPKLTKEMYDEVMKNPPFDPCECDKEAMEKQPTKTKDGPCPPVQLPVCPDPEIECELEKQATGIACDNKGSSQGKGKAGDKPKLTCHKKGQGQQDDVCGGAEQHTEDPCKDVEKKQASCEAKAEKPKVAEKKSKAKCDQPKLKECKQKPDDCKAKKQKCEEQKAGKKSSEKVKGKDKSDRCRNTKVCGKGGKAKKKSGAKKAYPKKCSDLLKEDDKKAKKSKPAKKAQMADLCKKKTCAPKKSKPAKKHSQHPAVLAAKCPPKRSFWQKIVDFFRARPNCPAPDQWKKDKLRRKAEQAAAAAGMELCEKKKPKVVTVTCKKTGVRDSKLGRKGKRKGSTCQPKKKAADTCKKSPPKKSGGGKAKKECKKIKSDCSSSGKGKRSKSTRACPPSGKKDSKPKKEAESEGYDDCKVADVVKAKDCGQKDEDSCVQEETVDRSGNEGRPGKCKLPRQKFCKPPFRKSCKEHTVYKPCTTVEAPYPCFSDCKKNFPKLPIDECTEQDRNASRRKITYDYDDPKKGVKRYSTWAVQKRFYSNSRNNSGKNFDPFALFDLTKDSLKDMDNNELALKILSIVKAGVQTMAVQNNFSTKKKCDDIFKELEGLCEEELNKSIAKDAVFTVNTNKQSNGALLNQKSLPDLEQTVMADAIKNLCQNIFSMPNLSTWEYEETGKQIEFNPAARVIVILITFQRGLKLKKCKNN